MIPKEYQKSNLALELKAGKKRLEDTLHVLSDEQCERAGVTRSGSVLDVLSELAATEFLALMEVSEMTPGRELFDSSVGLLTNALWKVATQRTFDAGLFCDLNGAWRSPWSCVRHNEIPLAVAQKSRNPGFRAFCFTKWLRGPDLN